MNKLYYFLILLFSVTLFAEGEVASTTASTDTSQTQMPSQAQHQMIGQLGFSKLGGDYYVLLNLGYEFNLGLIGIGVQAPFNILASCETEGGCDDKVWNQIRKEDWNEFTDYLKMIRYVRYGNKFDESNMFYARVGQLSNAYIGHATIMNGYINNIDWNTFKPGVQFDFYTNYGGIETVTDDITDPNILGFRGFVRPLSFVFSPESYLSRFALGTSYIADIEVPSMEINETTGEGKISDENFGIIGIDTEFRIFKNNIITVTPYIDYNSIIDYGWGLHFGVDMRINVPLLGAKVKVKPEYRIFGDEYIPMYFNSMYEIEKKQYKYTSLEGKLGKQGYYVELGYDQYLLELLLFQIGGYYEDYEGKNNTSLMLFASVPVLDNYKFSAIYSKRNFDKLSDAFDPANAIFIAEVSVNISGPLFAKAQYQKTWFYETDYDVTPPKETLESKSSYNFGLFVAFTF